MAIYVGVKKYLVEEPLYYYHVYTNDFGGVDFYISIDSFNKIVNIFKDRECTLFACCIDFNKPNEPINCSNKGINETAVPFLITPIFKALKNHEFPEYLSYSA